MDKVSFMSELIFRNEDGNSFSLRCIVAPTYTELAIDHDMCSFFYIAIVEDDNSAIITCNNMLDSIYQYAEAEYKGVMYKIEYCEYPSNTTYYDHIDKDINCMILLSLTKIE